VTAVKGKKRKAADDDAADDLATALGAKTVDDATVFLEEGHKNNRSRTI
jgi:hypothetical protein